MLNVSKLTAVCLMAACAGLASTVSAATFSWVNTGTANWSDNASWDIGSQPYNGQNIRLGKAADTTPYTIVFDAAAKAKGYWYLDTLINGGNLTLDLSNNAFGGTTFTIGDANATTFTLKGKQDLGVTTLNIGKKDWAHTTVNLTDNTKMVAQNFVASNTTLNITSGSVARSWGTSLTIRDQSTLRFTIDKTGTSSMLLVSGTFSLIEDSKIKIAFDSSYEAKVGDVINLMTYGSFWGGDSLKTPSDFITFTNNAGMQWDILTNNGSVQLQAVAEIPEPATVLSLGALGMLALLHRRK